MLKQVLLTGLFFVCFTVSAQCNKLVKITQQEFDKNFVQADTVVPSPTFKKVDNAVKIPGTDLVFEDEPDEENMLEYSAAGILKKNIYVVLQQDIIMDTYYLISNKPDIFQEICGNPQVYGNLILALETPHTDYPVIAEIWKLDKNAIVPVLKIELKQCTIYNPTAYLSKGYLYIKNQISGTSEYYKMKISE